MSNDLLKMHLKSVYERADRKLSEKTGGNKTKNTTQAEKSQKRVIEKVRRSKVESNYLDNARLSLAKQADQKEKLKRALITSTEKSSKSFSRKGLKKLLKVQRGY